MQEVSGSIPLTSTKSMKFRESFGQVLLTRCKANDKIGFESSKVFDPIV